MIDGNEFFRQATLRICGSLDIEKALWDCFTYVRRFIPGEVMRLLIVQPDTGLVKNVATATEQGGRLDDVQVNIPRKFLQEAEVMMRTPMAEIYHDLNRDERVTEEMKKIGLMTDSGLSLTLVIEGTFIGILFLGAAGIGGYREEHARLMGLLIEPWAIALSNCLRYREVHRLKEMIDDDRRFLQHELRRISGQDIIGADFGLSEVMDRVRQVAPTSSPVLLTGETGVGKEVIASAIHDMSVRHAGPFIKVNCGAIPPGLMDSELFGHEKGAFTGAISQKRGLFERASQGTIFLDEIGELTPEVQVRLLRVLQEKEIERVGGDRSIKLDLRVIAATHRRLETLIDEGRFREDLYFRLMIFPIHIPPLRERISDLPALVQHFLEKKTQELGLADIPPLRPGTMERLMDYRWPGNVRELENAVERALIVSRGRPLTFESVGPLPGPGPVEPRPAAPPADLNLDSLMARHIRRALAESGGRVEGEEGAARKLGLQPNTLRYRMRKLGVPYGRRAKGLYPKT